MIFYILVFAPTKSKQNEKVRKTQCKKKKGSDCTCPVHDHTTS